MATSSRQSSIFGVNDWKSIYKNYSQADFQSYDYETLRKTFVDYLRTYYPETFNDYVESSEYIALLDVMAYMGQALAFRNDLNTRENFIDTAERRDSVIKLANLVGYTPKRNIAGQGYAKMTSISTTEQIRDVNNLNLSNLTILWNDPANPNWQEQYNSIINASLIDTQRVGKPGNSKNILNIKTDEYSIYLPSGATPTVPFSAVVDGMSMNFEGVSVTSVDSDNLYEIPPGDSSLFNIVYRNDKLGYGSPNTGFFIYFKQGSLNTYSFNVAEQITNNSIPINIEGINNTDTWLYQSNQTNTSVIRWRQVESVYANDNLQKLASEKKVYSVNSRTNDQVTYIFGDGVFSEVPVGNFVALVRSSNGLNYVIDPSEFQGITVTIPYTSRTGRAETLTVTMDLQLPISTAQQRETIVNIKERAPQRYYTQNRMVNGEDYNNFPYTLYGSIIKSKAINRSSVGVSRNYDLLDPSARYSSTNDFADDGGLYETTTDGFTTFTANTTNDITTFLSQTLPGLLSGNHIYQYYAKYYTRYVMTGTAVFWNQTFNNSGESNGYFYSNSLPIPVGVYTQGDVQYITEGALLGFTAPPGFYFSSDDNRLIAGIPSPSDLTAVWTSVLSIVGDGYNNGNGNLNNGLGPINLSNSIPDSAVLSVILPSLSNTFGTTLTQECITKIRLNQNFSLRYDNSLLANQERWYTSTYSDENYFVKFQSLGSSRYSVTYKSIAYHFASVSDIRFTYDRDKIIYDPNSGKLLQDTITVLKTNTQPINNYPLSINVKLNVVGQQVESDGYVDDFSVEVSNFDLTSVGSFKNPDFFYDVTGYLPGTRNVYFFCFFQRIVDANLLARYEMINSSDIVYAYGTQSEIAIIKYEYPVGQVYYAVLEEKFYKSVNDTTSANIVNLVQQTDYSVSTGRQGLFFQYKHISGETTRIDPATTNIIDMYVLTQAYYTAYQNWLRDTTGAISEPDRPTINELTQSYSNINEYKMLSDAVIINSARFKPLFGAKASPELQGTIKVIKSPLATLSDSEIRTSILSELNAYFSIDNWTFGDTFYFSELSAYLHSQLGDIVSSVILVPNDPALSFGDLYEINSAPYEIFVNGAQASNIVVISAITPSELLPAG